MYLIFLDFKFPDEISLLSIKARISHEFILYVIVSIPHLI